jgi:hypothetical protein
MLRVRSIVLSAIAGFDISVSIELRLLGRRRHRENIGGEASCSKQYLLSFLIEITVDGPDE